MKLVLDYAVWAEHKTFIEEAPASKVMARFAFLQEAIDYAQYAQRRGVRAILTGPYGLASIYDPLR